MKIFLIALLVIVSPLAFASRVPPAYQNTALKFGIPANVLYSVALVESGYTWQGQYHPWPWTLNVEGMAYRFSYYSDALEKLNQSISEGRRVDVGLMQINSYWHRDKYESPENLLNPFFNLEQGARILKQQKKEHESWWDAVGRYHAPGKDEKSQNRAKRYRIKVKSIHDSLEDR